MASEAMGTVAWTASEEVEKLIMGIWREVLQIERLDRDDNFFERGGSSLLAVKVTARILTTLGIEIAIREIFRHPTLAQFVDVVTDRRRRAVEAALLGDDEHDRQLLERVLNMSAAEVAALNQNLKKGR